MDPSCILFKPIHQLINLHSLFIMAVENGELRRKGNGNEGKGVMKERPGKTEHTSIKKLHVIDEESESLRETQLT